MSKLKQNPLILAQEGKRGVRTQFGALCYRIHNGKTQVLLVTSRGTKRWIIPKGWPMDNETPSQAAATEAFEEAGAKGRMHDDCLGIYTYRKTMGKNGFLPCVVAVFPLRVKKLVDEYCEAGERKRKWVSAKKAARMVAEPDLAQILLQFDPKSL